MRVGKEGCSEGGAGDTRDCGTAEWLVMVSSDKEKKKNKEDEDGDDDEGSEAPSLAPRNLSYSSNRAKLLKSPAKCKKAPGGGGARCPPDGSDDDEEEGEIHEDEHDDDDESGSGHSYTGIEIAIDHAKLYDWLLSWTKEHDIPGITPMGVFNTLCLDGTMDEWLTGVEEAAMPNAWADVGWAGMSPGELVCVFTYITILLTLGDLAVETGILTQSQSEMFWSYRQTMIYYAADALVHKTVVDLSRMVRVCLTSLTPKKRANGGGGKSSRMAYGKEETLIASNSNAGKRQVAARLRSCRDCTGDNETQLTEQSLLNAIKNQKKSTKMKRNIWASLVIASLSKWRSIARPPRPECYRR